MKKNFFIGSIIVVAVIVVVSVKFLSLISGSPHKDDFNVRVRVSNDKTFMIVKSETLCDLVAPSGGETIGSGLDVAEGVRISYDGNQIKVGTFGLYPDRVRIVPREHKGISVDGVAYRGDLDVLLTDDGLDAINVVGLEDYLKGVVPSEVNSFWPSSALKAQAIVSRSFAVYKALRRRSKEYDLTNDTYSQVYKGRSAENWRTTNAVEATRGLVLEYEGKVLPSYFHSCCGGHTEDASVIWSESSRPLKGVKCPWCRWSPHFRWGVRVPAKKILEGLDAQGYDIKRVDDIRSGDRDRSGRLIFVRVRSGNQWFEIPVRDIRHAVGTRYLKSSKFKIKKYPRFYFFSGYGWGHGVGMCQWGAFGLAMRWKNTAWILKHYYPGAKIVQLNRVLGKKEK